MLKRFPHSLILPALLQLLATCLSCSVKEVRDLCPCLLRLDFSGNDSMLLSGGVFARICGQDSGFEVSETLEFDQGLSTCHSVRVPREELRLLVVCPPDGSFLTPDNGKSFPHLWMDCLEIAASGEASEADVVLHKSYCEISMSLRGSSAAEVLPFGLEVWGNVWGYSPEGIPAAGAFRVPVQDGAVCVPRQIDNSLKLDIVDGEGIVRTFALGNYMEESGYDWSAPDLADIQLEIDWSRTSVTFSIARWSYGIHFETVL